VESTRNANVASILPHPVDHSFDFNIDEQKCSVRYTYGGAASVSVTINTNALLEMFKR
jgi:hypothetical protein